jgi:hypothetical protein
MPTFPTHHEVAAMVAGAYGLGIQLDPDPDCGPSVEERSATRDKMLEAGMTDDVLFTPERFRFMRKANRNNRVDLQALLGTGFRFRQADLPAAVTALAAWYGDHRWII